MVVEDLKTNVTELEGNMQDTVIAGALSGTGLKEMSGHFILQQTP